MTKTYAEELVYTHAEDGVLLAGALTTPTHLPPKPIAVINIHGRPISAFLPMVSGHAREITSQGYACLAANTRGHDIGTWLFR
jgi:dipeptidyl aminopeptidase/acylaminoacyl peptidase